MWTKAFWKGAAERCIRAFVAAFLAIMLGGSVVEGMSKVDIRDVGWVDAASYGAGAALISLCLSLLSNGIQVSDGS
jgi:hypothetical protein